MDMHSTTVTTMHTAVIWVIQRNGPYSPFYKRAPPTVFDLFLIQEQLLLPQRRKFTAF